MPAQRAGKLVSRRFRRLSNSQAAFLNHRLEAAARRQPALRKLQARLVQLGGLQLVPPLSRDPDLRLILRRGEARGGSSARRGRGRRSDCHGNVSRLFLKSPATFAIATGYALSDDGLWRPHSWGVRNGVVIETTEPRLVYFGITLSRAQGRAFARQNA